jgi:hypothetical protein
MPYTILAFWCLILYAGLVTSLSIVGLALLLFNHTRRLGAGLLLGGLLTLPGMVVGGLAGLLLLAGTVAIGNATHLDSVLRTALGVGGVIGAGILWVAGLLQGWRVGWAVGHGQRLSEAFRLRPLT